MSSTREIERRVWPVEGLEVRAKGDDGPTIRGYAAVFNQLSDDLGGFRERVAEGAFARSLAQNDIRALWEHNPQYVIGRNKAQTLALREDEHGLRIEASPPATTWAADLLASMERGDVNQMSFGFYVVRDNWETDEVGNAIRTLLDVELFDVSVVTYPAYPQTSAEARAMAGSVAGGPRRDGATAGRGEDDGQGEAGTQARPARLGRLWNEIRLVEV